MRTDGWVIVELRELVEAIYDGPHATPKKTSAGPVFLGISALEGGRLRLDNVAHLSEQDFVKWTRRVVPKGNDVVFSYETRLGEAALIPEGLRCCLGRRMGLLRPDTSKVDPRFLLYAWLGPEFQEVIRNRTVQGSTVERILLTELGSFPVRIPSLDEQRAIAAVLGALDDKIELSRRLRRTLDELCQGPYASLIENAKDAFPTSIGQVAEVVDCLHSKKPGRVQAGKFLLQLSHIADDGIIDLTDPFYISDNDYLEWTRRFEAAEGDCVITNVGRVGAVGQMPSGAMAALGRNMTGLRLRAEYSRFPTFLIEALRSQGMRLEIERLTDSGTILNSLNVRSIPHLKVTVPSTAVLEDFEAKVRPLRAQMEHTVTENQALAAMRNLLLPKLISGEIHVRHADALSEAAT